MIGRCLLATTGLVSWLAVSLFHSSPLAVAEARSSRSTTVLERGILAEMNKARANPPAYASSLMEWRRKFRGKRARLAPNLFLETKEGVAAVDEAIAALQKIGPVPTLRLSSGLSAAARDQVIYQGRQGLVGHSGRNKSTPFERMNLHGRWLKVAGENISYGPNSPQAVVRDLIVDDGVPDRGHRTNIFRKEYRVTGVACGSHKTYRTMCVIGYAAAYEEKSKLRIAKR
jgi:uncharacterized protein YkwD